MRFEVVDDELSAGILLDTEPESVDLTADDLGGRILHELVGGMLDGFANRRSPDGRPWAPLARSTIKQKGHDIPGARTGLFAISISIGGVQDIRPREAWWSFPKGERWEAALAFQERRPWLGWTLQSQDATRRLIAEAAPS